MNFNKSTTPSERTGEGAGEARDMAPMKAIAGSEPDVLPMLSIYGAAEPIATSVTQCPCNGGWTSSVVRIWDEKQRRTCDNLCGDQPCSFIEGHGVCTVVVPFYVDAGSGAGFRR